MWLHQICIHAWQNICMFTHVELVDTPAPPFLLGGMTAAFAFLSSLSSSKKGAKDSESESCSETKALSFTKVLGKDGSSSPAPARGERGTKPAAESHGGERGFSTHL